MIVSMFTILIFAWEIYINTKFTITILHDETCHKFLGFWTKQKKKRKKKKEKRNPGDSVGNNHLISNIFFEYLLTEVS